MNPVARKDTRLATALAATWLAWFAAGALYAAWQVLPQPDDVLRAHVGKNWANGFGYASSYSDRMPFPPDISLGPAMVLPEGILAHLSGNALWVPGIAACLTNLAILLACAALFRKDWTNPMAALAALLASCTVFMGHDFITATGYYTAQLLVLWAALLLLRPGAARRQDWLAAGIVLALASLTKTLSVISQAAVVVIALLSLLARSGPVPRWQLPGWLAIGYAALAAPWALYRHATLQAYSPDFQAALADYSRDFFLYHGSGIGQWMEASNPLDYFRSNTLKNARLFALFMEESRLSATLYGGGLLLAGLAARRCWQQQRTGESLVLCAIALAALANLSWFLFVSFSLTPGHSVTAAYFGILACLLAASALLSRQLAAAFTVVVATLTASAQPETRALLYAFTADSTGATQDLQAAADYLDTHPLPYPAVGCGFFGYPRHLEYLREGSLHFRDCYDLIADHVELDTAHYLEHNTLAEPGLSPLEDFYRKAGIAPVEYRFHWKTVPGFTLVLAFPSMSLDPYLGKIVAACGNRLLFRNHQVGILECPPDAVAAAIEPDRIMQDIVVIQRWYKTRLNPYEGKVFPTWR